MNGDGSPERPAAVPEGALWVSDSEQWELVEGGGAFRRWRSDGTLYMTGRYEGGVQAGPFSLYHPDGELAREGTYVGGQIQGVVTAYASEAPDAEPLRSCCVPPGAIQMKARYDRGQLQGETFFDGDGRALLSDGTPRPERPAHLPASAQFEEYDRRWADGSTHPELMHAVGGWRYWAAEGRLDEEAEFEEGRKTLSRTYAPDGKVAEEVRFLGDNVRHGPYRRRFYQGGPASSPYADPAIVEEQGGYDHGHPVGRWQLLDAAGTVRRTVELGRTQSDADLAASPVFRDEMRSAAQWWAFAQVLRTEGRAREAIAAAARAAGRGAKVDDLRAFVAETTMPVTTDERDRLTLQLGDVGQPTVEGTLDALVSGADPAAALRSLASLLTGATRACLDLVEAAILLAPERPMVYLTRGLIRLELGDAAGARADADRVAEASTEAADFLREYTRVLFPAWEFWPAREAPASQLDQMPEAPEQGLEALRRAIQVYATRLRQIRAALLERLPGAPAWLPPELPALLPQGPLELRSFSADIVDETDDGPETSTVQIDERLDLTTWTVPSLMRLARAQWMGLCWLCWSAGLDEVRLPTSLIPRDDFPLAAGMAIARHWRAQDAVSTRGLRAMTAGVPGFVWEGMDIEGIPSLFAEMACDEYMEMRSVFLFLASGDNVSPFQSDIRQPGA